MSCCVSAEGLEAFLPVRRRRSVDETREDGEDREERLLEGDERRERGETSGVLCEWMERERERGRESVR